jgi:hypothetical protein
MVKVNRFIEGHLSDLGHCKNISLDRFCEEYINRLIFKDGFIILDLHKDVLATPPYSVFFDATGIECNYNSIHLDGLIEFNSMDDCVCKCIRAALATRNHISQLTPMKSKILVSINNLSDVTIRCHLVRPGESWEVEDIDQIAQGAITIE